MAFTLTRRAVIAGATAIAGLAALPALAQDKPKLRFSAVFSDKDIRAQMTQQFADAIGDEFVLEPYYGGNL
ncbi:MAG TPA: C4-dicarboxylate ABC transporter, partial [Amaricoccus sp.]|nr:C4-dicarboxylate ABC transporter [Amaricoccus sp.]